MNKASLPLFALLAGTAPIAGACAGIDVTPVTTENAESADGFRYFMPKTYLVVKQEGDAITAVETLVLPDPTREFAAEPYNWIASSSYDLTFNDSGVLTGTAGEVDTVTGFEAVTDVLGASPAFVPDAAAEPGPRLRIFEVRGGETGPEFVEVTAALLDGGRS